MTRSQARAEPLRGLPDNRIWGFFSEIYACYAFHPDTCCQMHIGMGSATPVTAGNTVYAATSETHALPCLGQRDCKAWW